MSLPTLQRYSEAKCYNYERCLLKESKEWLDLFKCFRMRELVSEVSPLPKFCLKIRRKMKERPISKIKKLYFLKNGCKEDTKCSVPSL